MNGLEAALAAGGLTVAVEPADDNPAMPNSIEGMAHWRVTVDGGVHPFAFPVSILREDADPSPPSPAEAFALLAADLRQPGLESGPDEWLGTLGADPDAAEPWLAARRHLLDLLEDARALPREIQDLLLGRAEPVPIPGPGR